MEVLADIGPSDIETIAHCLPHAFAQIASAGRWTPHPHLVHTGMVVARAVQRGGARLLVNMPPGTGKSEFLSHWVPLWLLRRDPTTRLILAANTDPRARKHGRLVRNEAANNAAVGINLAPDSKAKSLWHTTAGGSMVCVGIGTAAMGERGNTFLIDDPYRRWADAYSPLWKEGLQDWFHSTVKTRLEPDANVIIIHHRVAPDDLTGYLLETQPGEWEHVRLPALAEPGDPLGRETGGALCPARYDRAHYEHERGITPAEIWAAMYQQAPMLTGIGAVYHRFGEWNLDGALSVRPDLPIGFALDFNINPGMHGLAFQYDRRADMFTFLAEFHGARMNVMGCCKAFAAWRAKHCRNHEVHLFGDASGSAEKSTDGRSDWAVVRECLRGMVVRDKVPPSNPAVVDRVTTLNDALRDVRDVEHVKIHPACERLVVDLRLLRRDEDGHPDESNRLLAHASSAAGYAVHYLRPVGGGLVIPRGRFVGV